MAKLFWSNKRLKEIIDQQDKIIRAQHELLDNRNEQLGTHRRLQQVTDAQIKLLEQRIDELTSEDG